jgi:hypothetical protein
MQLLNGSGMAAGYTLGMDPSGAEWLVVAVKGTFVLPNRSGDEPKLAAEQVPLVNADLFTGEPGFSATLVECDYAVEKPRCDVLLNGAAYAPGGRPTQRVMVGLQIGNWRKSFVALGDRVWRNAGVAYIASEPVPFVRMPISYDNAFGGSDDRLHDPVNYRQYPPNPVGRGWRYHRYPERITDSPLPNSEEPGDPVRDPQGKYRPMAFGPIGRGWPPRIKYAGTYDQNWQDNVFPFLPADFNTRYYQCAPEDRQIAAPQGGERVIVANLTADGRREFEFPRIDMPVVFFRRRGNRVETKGVIDTVVFEPEDERFSIVWRAKLKLQRDIFEVPQCTVGQMSRAWWRSVETGKTFYPSLGAAVRGEAMEREDA